MTKRRSQTAAYAVAMVLFFVVGVLVGQQFCAHGPATDGEDGEDDQEVVEKRCPPSLPVIYEYCPPDPPPEKPDEEPPPPPPPPQEEEGDTLPEGPPPATAEERQRLLGWARDQSSTLESCPRDLGTAYRLAITIGLNDDDEITSVAINSDERELSGELQQCLRERILQWGLPEDLSPPQRELFFQLTL